MSNGAPSWFAGADPLLTVLSCIAALLALFAWSLVAVRAKNKGMHIYVLTFLLTMAVAAVGLAMLLGAGAPRETVLPLGLPWLGAHFRLDALSSAFLVIINVAAAGSSLFAVGYGRHETAPRRVVPFFPLFLAAMNVVVLAADAFSFLVAWEFMSLSSWALVVAHHRDAMNRRAAFIYLLMASVGGVCLMLTFGLLAGAAGGYDFATMRDAAPAGLVAAAALALVLLGAGSKAGLVPLHVWLPLAHPAAPSHVSAVMSGAMTKVAIYAFIRIIFDLIGSPQWWWGLVVLVLGGVTAALGVLFALVQTDLKRVLAYSTIENIGFVFVGLGLALAFHAGGFHGAAALSFTAALFHAFNHALFKTLLFCGSGAVLNATGERDMDKLGGLIHRMPQTALLFLAGCVAISALPPFNGFASEWLTLQAVLASPQLTQWPLKILVPGVGALLALSAALAGACFVRAYGIVFLGRPRTVEAAGAHDVDVWSRAAMAALALCCLAAGLLPGFVVDALAPVNQAMLNASMPTQAQNAWLSLTPIAEARSSYNGLLIFVFIVTSIGASVAAIHVFASRALRRTPAWDCGYPDQNPATQYSASSVSQPIRRVFGESVFRAIEHVDMPAPGDTRPARFALEIKDRVWDALFVPIASMVSFIAERLNHLQFLTIRRYLSFVFGSLVVLLLVLALWP